MDLEKERHFIKMTKDDIKSFHQRQIDFVEKKNIKLQNFQQS